MHKYFVTATLIALAGTANAQLVASFSYENLDSNYNAADQVLSTTSMLSSSGSVSRLFNPVGVADFGPGSADFALELNVSNITATSAEGLGSLLIRDLTGDTITADIHGDFTFMPLGGVGLGILFFDGMIDSLTFNNISGDGQFDGDTTAINSDFSGTGLSAFEGALQRLQISNVGFFSADWSDELAEVDGQIVPAPGVASLLAVSGLVCIRRRR